MPARVWSFGLVRRWVWLFAAVTLLPLPWCANLHAQADAERCTLKGRVLGAGAAPVSDAVVELTAPGAGAALAQARTDVEGRFCLNFSSHGEFVLAVEAPGFLGTSLLVEIPAGAGSVTRDVHLSPAHAIELDGLVVQAPRLEPETPRRGAAPGSTLQSRAAYSAAKYPGSPGSLVDAAGVAGEMVPTGPGELSIRGLSPGANRVTLDGAGFGGTDVPPEALAAAGVFIHPYDVSRGQFTGGEIAGRTMSGTNLWGGAVQLAVQHPWLQYGGGAAGSMAPFRQGRVSGGGGGSLLPGRLFVFGAAQALARSSELSPLGPAGLGVPLDSLQRFGGILDELGFALRGADVRGGTQATSASAIVRFDYLTGKHHTLTVRLDGRHQVLSSAADPSYGTPPGVHEKNAGGGAFAQVLSRIGPAENELRVSHSLAARTPAAAGAGPAGEVWVAFNDANAQAAGRTLFFGSSPFVLPGEDRSVWEVHNQLHLRIGPAHRLQVGGTLQRESARAEAGMNRFGRFVFASLADLEAGRPVRYTRALSSAAGEVATDYAAVFLGDFWRIAESFRVVYGLRGERYAYSFPRGPSTAIDSLFGLTPVPRGSGWEWSPRAGFGWNHRSESTSASIAGGAGVFRGAAPTRSLAALRDSEATNLVCVGSSVPAPQWRDYAHDPGLTPGRCTTAPGQQGTEPVRDVLGFSSGFAAPTVFNSSLSVKWLDIPSSTGAEITLSATRGWGIPLAVDRNLRDEPAFRLAREGGRPVYVAVASLDSALGYASPRGSRRLDRYGTVREVNARGHTEAHTFSAGAHRLTGLGLVEGYYTWTRSREETTGLWGAGGGRSTTAADPRVPEWGPTDFEQQHAFQGSTTRFLRPGMNLTLVGRLLSGVPFTPLVQGDVNGDGVFNDRAFIFDPTRTADPKVAEGIESLLQHSSPASRACLLQQLGRIAARNSCRTAWSSFLDAQLNISVGPPRRKRLTISVVAENVMSGMDYLLHGSNGLRGWGHYPSPDPVLLRVRGFDTSEREYRYEVNPNFGRNERYSVGQPFALRIQGRIALGADPATQALVALVNSSHARIQPSTLRAEMLREWRNLPALVLDRASDLKLTTDQLAQLRAAGEAVAADLPPIADSLAQNFVEMSDASPSEAGRLLERQGDLLLRADGILQAGYSAVHSVLSADQWARLSRALRTRPRAMLPIAPTGGVSLAPDF